MTALCGALCDTEEVLMQFDNRRLLALHRCHNKYSQRKKYSMAHPLHFSYTHSTFALPGLSIISSHQQWIMPEHSGHKETRTPSATEHQYCTRRGSTMKSRLQLGGRHNIGHNDRLQLGGRHNIGHNDRDICMHHRQPHNVNVAVNECGSRRYSHRCARYCGHAQIRGKQQCACTALHSARTVHLAANVLVSQALCTHREGRQVLRVGRSILPTQSQRQTVDKAA